MKWENLTLQEVCTISKGKKHSEVEQSKTSHRYIQIEDIQDSATLKYTEELGTRCTENDVLIAWDGANAGMVGRGLNGMIGSTLARLKVVSKEVYPFYLYWFLKSKFIEIKSQRTGATIPHVNGGVLRNMKVPIPPLHIQEQIADTLDKADALRRKDQELLTKYDELAQAIFYDMFGDPLSSSNKYPVSTFGDEIKIKGGKRLPLGHQLVKYETGLPYIKAGDIKNGKVLVNKLEYLLPETQLLIKNYIVQENDVCVTIVGANIGDVGIVPKSLNNANLTENAAKLLIKDKNRIDYVYLSNYWSMPFMQSQIKQKSMAVGVPKLALFRIEEMKLIIPPLEIQKRFNVAKEKIDRQRHNIEISFKKSNSLLDALSSHFFKETIN